MVHSINAPMCLECNEGIFNPICPSCLKQEILQFLYEIDKSLYNEFEQSFNQWFVPAKSLLTQQCIACGKKTHETYCPYCYTEKVYEWLKKNKPRIVKVFLRFFNFDFDKTGYSRTF